MSRSVILLVDTKPDPAGELFEVLSVANISFQVVEVCDGDAQRADENPRPLAMIYHLPADTSAAQLKQIVDYGATRWPTVPLVGCRPQATVTTGRSTLSREQLKRLGFRAVADSPAQLPALLREVEEIPGTGELREPDYFKSIPEPGAFVLPSMARSEQIRVAFALLASLQLATNQKEAAQAALAGLARLIKADRWSIFLCAQNSSDAAPAFSSLATRNVPSLPGPAFDDAWRRELIEDLPAASEFETAAAREAVAKMEPLRRTENYHRVLAAPLISAERVLGVIEGVRSRSDRRCFSRSEMALLDTVAISIAAALANSVRIAEAERLSLTDDLTRLHNARYLRQFLVNEIKRARRYSSSVAAVFLDLDDFKLVNDRHGHLVGSHVLMEVAALLLPSVRDTDCVVRYGGDEFLLILPDARLDDAIQVAERIRFKIEKQNFNGGRRFRISLTASLGVAAFPQHALSPQQLIACADRAMYQAKAANKNCLRVAESAVAAPEGEKLDAPAIFPAPFQRIPDEKLIS